MVLEPWSSVTQSLGLSYSGLNFTRSYSAFTQWGKWKVVHLLWQAGILFFSYLPLYKNYTLLVENVAWTCQHQKFQSELKLYFLLYLLVIACVKVDKTSKADFKSKTIWTKKLSNKKKKQINAMWSNWQGSVGVTNLL